MQDEKLSLFIEPTVKLIKYFKNNGHNIFIITARSGENGHYLTKLLSDSLGLNIKKNENLFLSKESIDGKRYTTKHYQMKN